VVTASFGLVAAAQVLRRLAEKGSGRKPQPDSEPE